MQRSRREPSGRGQPGGRGRITPGRLAVAVVAVAVLPVVIATIRAVARGWVPLNDDAYFSIRAYDVFSSQIPLVGMATSASLSAGRHLNHPGPLLFDLLAVPVRLFGSTAGVAIGIGLLNGLAVVGAAWVAFRRGGLLLLVPAMIVTSGLAWAMGSELLFEPWQPHSLLLPFLCFLFLAWGLVDGDLVLLPVAAGVGSLLVQTHVSYVYLVPALGFVGVVGLGWRLRRRVKDGSEPGRSLRHRLGIVLAVTGVVVVACWLQPVIEQVTRDGNLTGLLSASGDPSGPTLGANRSARVMASVVSLPPFFVRPSFADTLAPFGTFRGGPGSVGLKHLPSLGVALASLAVLGALLVAAAVVGHRRRDQTVVAGTVVAVVGLGVGYFTANQIPIEVFGAAAHTFRWLWPLGAFSAFVVLAAILRIVAGGRELHRRDDGPEADEPAAAPPDAEVAARPGVLAGRVGAFVGVGIGIVVLVSVLNIPGYNAAVGPPQSLWAEPVLRDIDRQIAAHPPRGPLLVDFSNTFFLEPYSTPIMAQLQRSGVKFVTDDATQIHQVGPDRRFNGRNARARILYRQGNGALTTPAGEHRIAFHAGLDPGEKGELDALVASGEQSDRRTELARRWDRATIGVFIAPLDGPRAEATP